MPVSRSFHDRPILVTGGAGFVGSHVVSRLVAEERPVRVFEHPGSRTDHLPSHVEIAYGDIRKPTDVARAMRDCVMVLHLADHADFWARSSDQFDQINHRGTQHVLDAARAAHVGRVVHLSTATILATPHRAGEVISERAIPGLSDMAGAYCQSKFRAEQAVFEAARKGLDVVILSPGTPVGPGDRPMGSLSRLIGRVCRGEIKGYPGGAINLVDVRDVAEGVCAAAVRGHAGQRYVIAGEAWSYQQLFEKLAELTGVNPPRFAVPYALSLAQAWIGEQRSCLSAQRVPTATVEEVRLSRRDILDDDPSEGSLGLRERRCETALRDAVAWLTQRGLLGRVTPGVQPVALPQANPPIAPRPKVAPNKMSDVSV